MRLSDGVYDRIKWIALAFIPALEVLILTVGKIWGLPYYAEIGATVAAVGVFLAAIIGVSSRNYYDELETWKSPLDEPEVLDDEEEVI